MKTSLSEIIRTEKFLSGRMASSERLVFEAQLLVDGNRKRDTYLHAMVHRLLKLYFRKKIKSEIEAVSRRLLQDRAFKESVLTNFKS